MATTIDKTVGGTDTLPGFEEGYRYQIRREYDCRTVALGGDGNVTSGNTLQLLNIPAGTFVERVALIKTTAEGAALTVDVGDEDGDADGFFDGADLNSTTDEIMMLLLSEAAPNTVLGYTNGRLYNSDDTIDMLFNNTADAAKFTLVAHCVRMKKVASTTNAKGSV